MTARYGRKVDDNQRALVNALRAFGCSVEAIQGATGTPDLIVGIFGVTELVEVKPASNLKARSQLRGTQAEWHARWKGRKPVTIRTMDDALALVSRMRGAMTSSEVAS